MVAAHDMEAEVQSRGAAGRCENRALVDIEHVRIDLYPRIAPRQHLGIAPVRGRAPAVQHPGCGQQENPGADRGQPAAALHHAGQGGEQSRRRGRIRALPTRHDHRVGFLDQVRVAGGPDGKPARRPERPRLHGANLEPVPGPVQLGPGQAENLVGAAELERAKTVIGQRDDGRMRRAIGHLALSYWY